MYTIIV